MAPRVEPDRDGSPPDQLTLTRILQAATTVPDHGGLHPWRFAVVSGPGKERLADALAAGVQLLQGPEVPDSVVAKMRGKAFAAPCTIVLIASPDTESNVPEWEQVASASCTGYAMVLAANALGLGAVWKSAAVLDTPPVRAAVRPDRGREVAGLDQRRLAHLTAQEATAGAPSSRGADHRHRYRRFPVEPGTVVLPLGPSVADEQAHRAVVGRLPA